MGRELPFDLKDKKQFLTCYSLSKASAQVKHTMTTEERAMDKGASA